MHTCLSLYDLLCTERSLSVGTSLASTRAHLALVCCAGVSISQQARSLSPPSPPPPSLTLSSCCVSVTMDRENTHVHRCVCTRMCVSAGPLVNLANVSIVRVQRYVHIYLRNCTRISTSMYVCVNVRARANTHRRFSTPSTVTCGHGRTETACERCTGVCPAGSFVDNSKCTSNGQDCCAPSEVGEAATCQAGFFPIRLGVGCSGGGRQDWEDPIWSEGAYVCCSGPEAGACPAGSFLDQTKCTSSGQDCCAPNGEAATCQGGFFPIRLDTGCLDHSEGAYVCCSEREAGACPAGSFVDNTKCTSSGGLSGQPDCCAPSLFDEAATCQGGFFPIRLGTACSIYSDGEYVCCSEAEIQPGCPAASQGPGCCLGQHENWCAENYAAGTSCVNNACGADDCCVPDTQDSHSGGVCSTTEDCLSQSDCVGEMVTCLEGICFTGSQDTRCNDVANGEMFAGQQEGHWCWDGRSDTRCAAAFTWDTACGSEAGILQKYRNLNPKPYTLRPKASTARQEFCKSTLLSGVYTFIGKCSVFAIERVLFNRICSLQ